LVCRCTARRSCYPGFGCRTRRLERRFIGYPIRAERSSAAPFEAWRRSQVVLSSNCECLRVRLVDMPLYARNVDRRTAEASGLATGQLRRQFATGLPHGVFPDTVRRPMACRDGQAGAVAPGVIARSACWNGSNRPWRDGCCFRKPTSTPVVDWACEMTSPPS
jgi:hypothetical protein